MTTKRIGLVAHDARKSDLLIWVRENHKALAGHRLFATGNTGALLSEETGLEIARLKSGPLGGDQQLGAMIASGELDLLIFFIDPLTALPHDVDVKALMRLSTLYNLPLACNPATADCIVATLLAG
jgi:methylglyoxal synthase